MSNISVIVISAFIFYLGANQANLVLPLRTIQLASKERFQDMGELFTKNRNYQLSTMFNNQVGRQADEKRVKSWMKNILKKNNQKIIHHHGVDYSVTHKPQYFQIQLLEEDKEQNLKRQRAWTDLEELQAMEVSIKEMQEKMAIWTRV